MNDRVRLFCHKDPYDWKGTGGAFTRQINDNVAYHRRHCPEYARILRREGFSESKSAAGAELADIPVIPTLYFKKKKLYSMTERKCIFSASSSGTKGGKSLIRIDQNSLLAGLAMAYRTFAYHGLISLRPVHYIILGYPLSKDNRAGAVMTSNAATWLAPALSRTYALKKDGSGGYIFDGSGLVKALIHFAKGDAPVRLLGFPAYMNACLKELEKYGRRLKLPKGSAVLLGGGWKEFGSEKIERNALYDRIERYLGIGKAHCHDFYSAVEHPVIYASCKNHHFHVPIYSRVIIRDCKTLEPLPEGQAGLAGFVTPIMKSMPLVSVVTDDLAVLHEAGTCGCGIQTPWFELLGRTGLDEIQTCAAEAGKLLGGNEG